MSDDPILSVEDLEKHYPIRKGFFKRQVGAVRAVDGITFEVRRGESVGIIGESGCGKSTMATSVLRLEEPTGGTIRVDGDSIENYSADELRRFRRRASMVFQNPTDSFDPKLTIGESVAEPLLVQGVKDSDVRRDVVADLLRRCGLQASASVRYPHELSDGQKQRAALARALTVDPDLLVADEPVSALDMSVQAEILSLLKDLQADLGLSMLVISHDIGVVSELCDRVCVMYLGEIVERGPTEELLSDPKHPYTKALIDAVAVPDPRQAGDREPLAGETPDAANPPSGCRFHPRCPSVITPEGVDLDSDTYRGIIGLKETLTAGDIDEESLRGIAESEGVVGSAEDGSVTTDDLRLGLRRAHDLPDQFDAEDVESTVSAAIEAAVGGEVESGAERLDAEFESVCERTPPGTESVGDDRAVACHLYTDAGLGMAESESDSNPGAVEGQADAD